VTCEAPKQVLRSYRSAPFGLHLFLIGYLAYRAGYVPRVLGFLLAISGLGYATDSLAVDSLKTELICRHT
jgi:Domain of unknown function (DUF4386)